LSVGHHHAGELGIATVGSWLSMTTKSSNLRKIELELVLQPVDSISGTAGQDGDKIVAGKVTSGFLGIIEEDPGAVLDAQVLLTLGSGAVDTGCGLGRVSTHEWLFVEEDDIGASLEKSVGGRETGETTTDDDNASH